MTLCGVFKDMQNPTVIRGLPIGESESHNRPLRISRVTLAWNVQPCRSSGQRQATPVSELSIISCTMDGCHGRR
jgi:hypothetical protein